MWLTNTDTQPEQTQRWATCKPDLIHTSCRSESSNISLVVLDKDLSFQFSDQALYQNYVIPPILRSTITKLMWYLYLLVALKLINLSKKSLDIFHSILLYHYHNFGKCVCSVVACVSSHLAAENGITKYGGQSLL